LRQLLLPSDRIAAFWTGHSFDESADGHELSSHLSRFLLNGLFQDISPEEQVTFLDAALMEDAGRQAAEEVLGISLDEALEHFLKG